MPPKRSRRTAAAGKADPASGATTGSRKRRAVSDEPQPERALRPRKAQKTRSGAEKKQKKETRMSTAAATDKPEEPVLINRAPVLELWGACVASFTHPDLSWSACVSIGSSISTITAISKGRAIGTIARPETEKKDKKSKNKEREAVEPTLHVMGFPMTLKGDAVVVKGSPKRGSEASLSRRFGDENLRRVKSQMLESLAQWSGAEDELDKKAFSMYEEFRPDVAQGQRGWGRKGELYLSKIDDAVRRK